MKLFLTMFFMMFALSSNAGTVQELIDEGVVVIQHDYRAGHMDDLSGNDNNGTATDLQWSRGVWFPDSTSMINVPDAPELQLTAGALVVVGDFLNQEGTQRILHKRDAGGTNYDFYSTATTLTLYDGTNTRTINTNITGTDCIAINMADGTKAEAFVDGVSIGLFDDNSAISVNDAPLVIGNKFDNAFENRTRLYSVLISSRILTATEQSNVCSELVDIVYPTMITSRAAASAQSPRLDWQSDWGAIADGVTYSAGYVGPFLISSGTWRVVIDTINGERVKVLEAVVAGLVSIPSSEFQQGTTNASKGTFDWWVQKNNAGDEIVILFVADTIGGNTATGQDGYNIQIGAAEQVRLRESVNGANAGKFDTGIDFINVGQWYNFHTTRNDVGEFTSYIDGTLTDVSGGSGINPVTDTTTMTSNYIVLDLGAGDKISLGTVGANMTFYKQQGVN